MSRLGHLEQRHPLCPDCGYDLVATVAAQGRVCPECGRPFELHELVRAPRPGDWTIWRGLRRLVLVLVGRTVSCAIVWAVLVAVLARLPSALGSFAPQPLPGLLYLLAGLVLIAAGGSIGAVVAYRIEEHAGFSSRVLVVVVLACAWTSILGGAMLAHRYGGVAVARSVLIIPITGLLALGIILKMMVLDDY